jgi:hypothetical protein
MLVIEIAALCFDAGPRRQCLEALRTSVSLGHNARKLLQRCNETAALHMKVSKQHREGTTSRHTWNPSASGAA